ncbi:MAG: hypothetical protein Q4F79_09300 [Eubacteriales bacterium]|nr:hypothetical protein [Eubacteriales bacterium]
MMTLLLSFLVAGVLLLIEYLLCVKQSNPLWGGILPVLLLLGTICLFASGKIPLTTQTIFPFVVLNTIFFLDWATGREKYKKLQQEELDKMKAKDI